MLFTVLAIMDEANMNISIHVFSRQKYSFHLNIYVGVKLVGHWISIFLAWEVLPKCFPRQLY